MKFAFLSFIIICLAINSILAQDNIDPSLQWPSYRGYYARGYVDNANLPDNWDVEKNIHIKWKQKIPGLSLSCPIVWGDKVFVATANNLKKKEYVTSEFSGAGEPVHDDSPHEWIIYCFEKNSGTLLWESTVHKGVPKVKRHPISTHANTTLATNGKYIVAFFGSEGLFCLDMKGNVKWTKDFGLLVSAPIDAEELEWEFASSPIIHKGAVLIQADVIENSFVASVDLETGKEIWKTARSDYPSWCTPNVYSNGDRDIVAINGYQHRAGYDFKTGQEVWRMSGGGDVPVPTPVVGDGLVYFNSAHGRYSPIYAIKTDAKGDLTLTGDNTTNNHIVWSMERGGSYMGTLLLYDGLLYNAKWNGSISCHDPKTGKEYYKENIDKGLVVIASPVAADGKIYLVARNGYAYTLKAGKEFELLAKNPLGEHSMVTPAITEGMVFFRTDNYLISVGKQ